MLQEAGLSHLLQPQEKTGIVATPEENVWLRGWKSVIGALGVIVAVTGLVVLYPWLSIQNDYSDNPTNPFETSFSINNEGYLPLTHLKVNCRIDAKLIHGANLKNLVSEFDNFADSLTYKHRLSLPCNRSIINLKNLVEPGATLSAVISYCIFGMRIHYPQTFKFKLDTGKDGQYHWNYSG